MVDRLILLCDVFSDCVIEYPLNHSYIYAENIVICAENIVIYAENIKISMWSFEGQGWEKTIQILI